LTENCNWQLKAAVIIFLLQGYFIVLNTNDIIMSTMPDQIIKIIITDDHRSFRSGVRTSLEKRNDVEVIGEAENGLDLLNKLIYLQPDIILLGVTMPVMDGAATLPVLKQRYPHIKVIMLTMHNDPDMICQLIERGASGYLTKETSTDKIYEAVRACYKKWFFINDTVINAFIARKQDLAAGLSHHFNSKERTILRHLHDGKMTVEIADIVDLSVRTVEAAVAKLKTKTGSKSLVELISYAVRHKLLE
jgi:DNA-binding NarL/FixJ family response regulator